LRRHERVRVLLVDDHPSVRDGLAGLLSSEPRYEIVAQAESAAEAIRLLRLLSPDLLLVDLRLPDADGTTVLEAAGELRWKIFSVVLSAFRNDDDVIAAARAGAHAYLVKTARGGEILHTLSRIFAGENVLAAELTPEQRRRALQKNLTRKELEILCLLARGCSNQEIGRQQRVAGNTVKAHLRNIFAKLGVANRAQAAGVAIRRGLAAA
jgi:DNA-binding NarL/FixJ family response regulator